MTDTNKLDIQVGKYFLTKGGQVARVDDVDYSDQYWKWHVETPSLVRQDWYTDQGLAANLDESFYLIQECDQHGNTITQKGQTMTKKTPRPHAELIKQWADDDSLVVEYKDFYGEWSATAEPDWDQTREYRFKPKKQAYEYQLLVKSHDGYYIHDEWFTKDERNKYIVDHGSEDVILILESERLRQE